MADKTTKNKSTNTAKENKIKNAFNLTREIIKNENFRFGAGIVLFMFAAYLIVTFLSFFSTGAEDFSVISQSAPEALNQSEEIIRNSGGGQGAKLAYTLINNGFGVASIFIIAFVFVSALRMMKLGNIRLRRWFLCCSFLTIWFSLFLGYTFYPLYKESFFYLGGKHGYMLSSWFVAQIGTVGFYLMMTAVMICFLIYLSSKTVGVIKNIITFKYVKDHIGKKADNENEQETDNTKQKESTDENEESDAKPANISDEENPKEIKDKSFTIYSNEDSDESEPEEYNADTPDNDTDNNDNDDTDTLHFELHNSNTNTIVSNAAMNANNGTVITGNNAKPKVPDMEIEVMEEEENADINTVAQQDISEPYDPRRDLEYYKFPTIDLLTKYENAEPSINMEEQNNNKNNIIRVLKSFGIEICSIRATVGPTITLYEITPEQGIRISKIRGLEDDIALSLKALGIRIIAPIPGKGTIGIEVPNSDPKIVSMQSIIASKKFQESTYDLPIAFGKTITNEVFMVDLAKMPHILVAGATGQGKSVGLNAIITSLIYKKHPAELKFVMIDPKKVEFSIYSIIEKHFLAKLPDSEDAIITDFTKVIHTLNSLCIEMDSRYDLLKAAHVRNIKEYNHKFISRQLNPEKGHKFMPYIVVVIDEFGDLIMTAGKDIELPIARIAQLARAVGIHMIIATQRPTTQIITGTIKANFPARVAFRVSSMIDSRTIIDRPGANQLIGKGDMLFLQGNDPVRVQCAFVDTPEVEKITHFISEQQGYTTAFYLPEYVDESGEGKGTPDVDMNNLDSKFEEAARLVVIHQQGSTSLIQRKFSIGFTRAGRIMDQLEKAGIVGPQEGSKPRQVLCADENDLEMKLNNLR